MQLYSIYTPINLIFSSRSPSTPGCPEKVWDSQDFYMSFAVVCFLVFEVEDYWQNLQPLTLDYGYIYLPYPQILFTLHYKKNVDYTKPVVYFSLRYICNWFLYSHANILQTFHLTLKCKVTDMGQSSAVYSKRSQTLSEKKNLSQEDCCTSIRCSGLLLKSWYVR